jgi:flagellar protein FliS
MLKPYNQYQDIQVTTSSSEKILIMLYDGAIRFSMIALDKLEKNNLADKGKYIGKVLAIIGELRSSLNHEVGGEISINLERLYSYMMSELSQANINNSAASVENVIKILTTLRDTWVEAIEILKKEKEAHQQSVVCARAAG